ncbi:MAG: hypothetical protein WBX22_07720 [Silvibacterium sp.]
MKSSIVALVACVALLPSICRGENLCPWINKATALGVLGASEYATTAKVSEISNASCSFIYRDGDITRELRVTVDQTKDWERAFNAYKARCGNDVTQLRAIGNEAVMCAANVKGQAEQVFGRVRDAVFTISVSTSARKDSSMSREALIQKAGLVAEQVSGNLF